MNKDINSTLQIKIRKHNDFLATCGYGTLVFVLWTLIKTIIYIFSFMPSIEAFTPTDYAYAHYFLFSVIIETIICIFISFKSIRQGKKNQTKALYITIASILLVIFSINYIVTDVFLIIDYKELNTLLIVALITDTVFSAIATQLVISSFILRHCHRLERIENER